MGKLNKYEIEEIEDNGFDFEFDRKPKIRKMKKEQE
jgi:hypothetical protein